MPAESTARRRPETPSLSVFYPDAHAKSTGGRTMTLLYTATIFVSAFLLFLIQPMFARMVLPLLGGSPSVWNTALLFYQAVLLLGYGYAHLSGRFTVRTQIIVQAVLVLLPLVVLPIMVRFGNPAGGASPVLWLLCAMGVSVGLPFFVVSSTSPLLQRWFAATRVPGSGDPYFLYAASNVGSMLALLGYPFFLEPRLRLSEQSGLWAIGYGLYLALVLACASRLWRTPGGLTWSPPPPDDEGRLSAPTWTRKVRWILLAFVPSSLMIGATTSMSTDIAAIPMLWVVPLALYLLTFILVFARKPPIPHSWMVALLPPLLIALVLVLAIPITKPLSWLFGLHLFTFFVAGMVCHGEMAKDRPSVRYLTEFFLLMSVGGVLGGLFNAIIAPMAFHSILEYPITLILACLLLPTAVPRSPESGRTKLFDFLAPAGIVVLALALIRYQSGQGYTFGWSAWSTMYAAPALACLLLVKRPHRFALAVFGLYMVGVWHSTSNGRVVYESRGFFGVLRVREDTAGDYRRLLHGTTLHGVQAIDPAKATTPLSYYHPTGPIGQVFESIDLAGADIAAVGLGVGSLAGYAKPGQRWRFYEIDPEVEKIARDRRFFTYLADCPAELAVVLGDARLSLESSDRKYRLIVLDAYSSDSVPVHLLTREALRLYLDRLEPGGVLAFHISNRHLDLEPVLGRLAEDAGLFSITRADYTTPEERQVQKASSTWTLMSREAADVMTIAGDQRWEPTATRDDVRVWTDDYSSVLTVLKRL
ncbi:MAG TPA: fused MFS/spermidine synthase [Fimbriimonadaceae bacterium]|nr:fused MFS/spermidine synthase [Fimbriimonadaceae bacterium]HRJ95365.1 fused MFS/spermidine synthase [Fimbriimonadaceae bacterium]